MFLFKRKATRRELDKALDEAAYRHWIDDRKRAYEIMMWVCIQVIEFPEQGDNNGQG